MTVLVDANFQDLKAELDIAEVWNEARVLLPSYSYTLELQDGVWVRIPEDYSHRYLDGESINKYGRRTKTCNKHVIHSDFGEAYCRSEVDKYKEPSHGINVKLAGVDSPNTILALATKISDRISYINSTSGLNDTGLVDSLQLSIDLDRIPRLTINLTEVRALDLLDWFVIDVDSIDGDHIIG